VQGASPRHRHFVHCKLSQSTQISRATNHTVTARTRNTRKHNHTENTIPTSCPSPHHSTSVAILSSHSIHHHTNNHAIVSPRQPTTATQTQHKHTNGDQPTHTTLTKGYPCPGTACLRVAVVPKEVMQPCSHSLHLQHFDTRRGRLGGCMPLAPPRRATGSKIHSESPSLQSQVQVDILDLFGSS
jgi:hypothetical protein